MKTIIGKTIIDKKLYRALKDLFYTMNDFDHNYDFPECYEWYNEYDKLECNIKQFQKVVKNVDLWNDSVTQALQKHYKCNKSGEYHINSLYGFAGLKCRPFMHDKARLNFICRVFMDLAKENQNIDYIIFKQDNN